MATKKTEVLTALIKLLEPLESEERARIIDAALTFLGQPSGPRRTASDPGNTRNNFIGELDGDLPPKAAQFLHQFGLSKDALDTVFHFKDGHVDLIASEVPGKDAKDKTVQCYLLTGVTSFLENGEATIDDKKARALCRDAGCYDPTNHSKRIKALGNFVAGSKAGRVLTKPGLKAAAETIKSIAGSE